MQMAGTHESRTCRRVSSPKANRPRMGVGVGGEGVYGADGVILAKVVEHHDHQTHHGGHGAVYAAAHDGETLRVEPLWSVEYVYGE